MTKPQKYFIGGALAVLALVGTAVAASYMTRESLAPEKPVQQQARIVNTHSAQPQKMAVAQPPCDDKNIVGTVGGAVAGGLMGNQFGKGSGKTVATVGGVAGGAYLGNKYIPARGAACN